MSNSGIKQVIHGNGYFQKNELKKTIDVSPSYSFNKSFLLLSFPLNSNGEIVNADLHFSGYLIYSGQSISISISLSNEYPMYIPYQIVEFY